MKTQIKIFTRTLVILLILALPEFAKQNTPQEKNDLDGKAALLQVLTTREALLLDPLNESQFRKYLFLWETGEDHAIDLDMSVMLKRDRIESPSRQNFSFINTSVTVPEQNKIDVETEVVFTDISNPLPSGRQIMHVYATFVKQSGAWKLTALTELQPKHFKSETAIKQN